MPDTQRPRWRASQDIQTRARELRRAMTPSEHKLWQRLRSGQVDGAHFRRQHAARRFIVDFVCARAKLVVEVDGDSHAEQVDYDAERTAWLEAHKGYRVMRFTNREVLNNMDAVLAAIQAVVHEGRP